jgi:hypothetical protein
MNNSVYDAAGEQVRGKFVKLQKPLPARSAAIALADRNAAEARLAAGALAGTGQSLRNRPGG